MKQLFILVFFCSITLFAHKHSHYSIKASLDDKAHSISGGVTASFVNNFSHPISEVFFLLPANLGRNQNPYLSGLSNDAGYENGFESKHTNITNVTIKEIKAPFSYMKGLAFLQKFSNDKTVLKITLPEKLAPKKSIKIQIEFSTTFPNKKGDEGYYKEMYTWRFGWFPQELQVIDNKWYSNGYSYAPITYDAEITLPQDYSLVSGGDRSKFKRIKDKKIYSISSKNFVLSIPIVIAKDLVTFEANSSGIQIYVHVRKHSAWFLDKPHSSEGLDILALSREIISYYGENFGKLKHDKLEIIESTSENAGLAANGFVLMPDLFFVYKNLISPGIMERYLEHFLAHEIAHSYWGLGVNSDFSKTNWLSESFAEYLSITYLEDKYGPYNNVFTPSPFFKYVVYNYLNAYFGVSLPSHHRLDLIEKPYRKSLFDGLDEPIEIDLKNLKFSEDVSTKWYKKGYLVTRAMENIIGRNSFHTTLKGIHDSSNGLAISSSEILKRIRTQTGKNLKEFADDWIYSAKTLDYEITDLKVKKIKKKFSTFVSIKNNGTGSMPGDLLIFDSNNKVLDHKRITVAPNAINAFQFETDKIPTRASIDEREFTPDYNRKNNFYPKKGPSFGFIFDSAKSDQNYLTFDIYLAMVQAIELRGGFLDAYKWSVLAGREPYTKDISFYLGKTSLTFDIGRNKYLYSFLTYKALSDDTSKNYFRLSAGVTLPFFTPIETGFAGRTTRPLNNLSIGLSYSDYSNILNTTHQDFTTENLLKAQYSIDINYKRDDLLKLAWVNTLSTRIYMPDKHIKTTLLSTKYFKPFGRMLLSTSLKLGASTRNILNINKFNLDHLNIYNFKIRDNGLFDAKIETIIKLARSRKTRVFGIAEKYVPILNFWVFEGINTGAYVRFSDVFNLNSIKDTFRINIVAGPKLQFLQSSFLGMPIDFTLSLAYPLLSHAGSGTYVFLDGNMRF